MIKPNFLFNNVCTLKRGTISTINGDASTTYTLFADIPCRYMLINENESAEYGKTAEYGKYGVWFPFYTKILKTDVILLPVANDPDITMSIDIQEIDNVQGMGQFIYVIGIEVK